MNTRRRAVTALISSACLVAALFMGAAPAQAANCTPGGDGVNSWSIDCWPGGTYATASHAWHLQAGNIADGITLSCPESVLAGSALDSTVGPPAGRLMIFGVDVSEPGGVGITSMGIDSAGAITISIGGSENDPYSRAHHWGEGVDLMTMTNWRVNAADVIVTVRCTTDHSKWGHYNR